MKAAYDKAITKHVFLFFSVCVCVSDPALTTAVAMMASSAALRPLSSVFASECLCFMSSSSARAAAPQALTLSDRAERQETPGGGGLHTGSHTSSQLSATSRGRLTFSLLHRHHVGGGTALDDGVAQQVSTLDQNPRQLGDTCRQRGRRRG